MLNVRKLPQAINDLSSHAEYIGLDSPAAAWRFLQAAEDTFERLSRNPELGAVGEFRSPELAEMRRWRIHLFTNYLVFYRVRSDCIEIAHIVHGSRDIEALFTK